MTVIKMGVVGRLLVSLSALGAAVAVIGVFSAPALAQRPAQAAPIETTAAARAAASLPLRPPGTNGTVLEIQPFQKTTSITLADQTRLWLTDINPGIRGRYLLVRQVPGRNDLSFVDIENPVREQMVSLGEGGLVVGHEDKRVSCGMRTADGRDLFGPMDRPIKPFCDGRLLVRSQQRGYRTTEEAAVSLLRSMGGFGESLISLYKTTVGQDENRERARTARAGSDQPDVAAAGLPRPAQVNPKDVNTVFPVHRLEIRVARPATRTTLRPGVWYPVQAQAGVAVSLIAPRQIDPDILKRNTDLVAALDETEADALVYLMAFDLGAFGLDYRVGTEHPGVEWSSRPPISRSNPAGPDGFETTRPLARVGMVPPHQRPLVAAAFAGGFKRDHGAFRYGALSLVNQGTHYGFIENGVVLSRLQPGLATLIGRVDGTIELRTWTERDAATQDTIVFARQNGLPLVEPGPNGTVVPGKTLKAWGVGNWSGALIVGRDPEGNSQRSAQLRTLRSGVCRQNHDGREWLLYAYFTSATPSAMARVFQAYGCSYAMLLDMNAPALAYAALYANGEGGVSRVERLDDAMIDAEPGGGQHRFLTANDNRDFFMVLRRPPPAAPDVPAVVAPTPMVTAEEAPTPFGPFQS